jgi:hypothetical protein
VQRKHLLKVYTDMITSFINFINSKVITEVLDMADLESTNIDITWEPPLSPKSTEKEYRAKFNVDGDPYVVGFSKVPQRNVIDYYVVWDLNRSAMSWWWVIKSLFTGAYKTFSRTGLQSKKGIGYTLKVIRGVFSAIRQFVQVVQPSIIQYHEADDDLKRFYNTVATKLAPKFGYVAHHHMLVKKESLRRPAVKAIVTKPLNK